MAPKFKDIARLFMQTLEARDAARLRELAAAYPEQFARLRDRQFTLVAGRNDVAAMELLSLHGTEINSLADDAGTALCAAARAGATDALCWLLDRGADPELRPDNLRRDTPLLAAAAHGHAVAVADLIRRGASLRATVGTPPRNALDLAIANGQEQVADLLRRAGLTETTRPMPPDETIIDRTAAEIRYGRLDLALDAPVIGAFLDASATAFNGRHPDDAVANVHLFFSLQSGVIDIAFGIGWVVNPLKNFDPIFSRTAKLPHWQSYHALVGRAPTQLTGRSGRRLDTRPPPRSEEPLECAQLPLIHAEIGDMLVALAMASDDDAPLHRLRRAAGCQVTVQDDEDWNWPAEGLLGRINLPPP